MTLAGVRRIRTIGLVVVAALLLGWFTLRPSPDRQEFSAVFTDASEVVARNDVRLNDVIVGKITGVDLDDLHARVEFSVDPDVDLPEGTRAELRQVSLLGEQYLALIPEGDGQLEEGTEIPLERTRRATDFEELVGAGGEITAGLSVARINQLVAGFGKAFGDDPERLGELIDATADVSRTFNDAAPDLEATIDRVEQMAARMAPESAEMADTLDDLAAGMEALGSHSADLSTFTTSLADFGERMATLLTTNEARLTRGLPHLRQVLTEVSGSLGDVETWLDNFYGFNASWSCIGDGSFLNETFLLMPSAGDVDYGPGKCDPEKGNASRTKQHQVKANDVPQQEIDTSDQTGEGSGLRNVYDGAIGGGER
jgi:phospholipid/cholesterol/gamma-HCH transport system substrate-binding protein